ncbi:MAG: hypothetical protein U9Q78_04795 [Chloroflexota bacterium]|nr:hypothetical protein [Chloroflexota bacterium]
MAICDIIPERVERAAGEFDIPHAYPSVEEMIAAAERGRKILISNLSSPFELVLSQA